MESKKLLFIGGHATPAFAVLERFLEDPDVTISWVGEKYNQRGNKNESAEYKTVVEKYNVPFISFSSGKLIRFSSPVSLFQSIGEVFRLILGMVRAFFIILRVNPTVIVSFGGFLAVPLVIWGKLLGKKIITHEQTITVGLANRITANFADTIAVSWKDTEKKYGNPDKVVFTGNPIRKDIFEITIDETERFRENLPLIYISCGNQGSHIVNITVFEILNELLEIANVFHQTGNSSKTNDFGKSIAKKDSLPERLAKRYHSVPYVGPDSIGSIFHKADLMISRAGANTITEQLATGKPAIVIPIPWASQNEQLLNAKALEKTGLGTIVHQDSLTPQKLLEEVKRALAHLEKGEDLKGGQISLAQSEAFDLVNLDAQKLIEEEIRKFFN